MRNDFETGYLEHSAKGTSWKKKGAKYLSRVWKNGRWVYEYKITGKGYLKEAEDARNKKIAAQKLRDKSTADYKKAYSKELEAAKSYKYNAGQEREALRNYNYWDEVVKEDRSKAEKQGFTKDRDRAASYLKETNKSTRDSYHEKENSRKMKESYAQQARESTRVAESNAKKEQESRTNYYEKSLAGKIESGKKTISKLLDSLVSKKK